MKYLYQSTSPRTLYVFTFFVFMWPWRNNTLFGTNIYKLISLVITNVAFMFVRDLSNKYWMLGTITLKQTNLLSSNISLEHTGDINICFILGYTQGFQLEATCWKDCGYCWNVRQREVYYSSSFGEVI